MVRIPCKQSAVRGTGMVVYLDVIPSSPVLQMTMGTPLRAVTCCKALCTFYPKRLAQSKESTG